MNTGYTPVQGRGFVRPENQNLQNFAEIIPVISGLIGGSETNIVNARALQMLDEKGVNLTYPPDGNQNMSIISEPGFYKLIKTKSAPLPERPCEQLTYCAKNESEQWDYINRVAKRHNCRITGKTKATAKGRQWVLRQIKLERIANNATFATGGQSVRFTPMTLGLTEGHYGECAGLLVGYSCSLALRRWSSSRATATSCPISSAALTPIFSTCASASSEETRGFSPLPSAWRRAISPRTAVTIKFALVSPGCRDASMPLTTSCGNLAFSCCDLLLTELVDMFAPPINNGMQCNTKVNTKKDLKWYSPKCNLNTTRADTCNSAIETTKPRTVGAVTGLLTTNDRKSIEVAMRNYTRHPQGRDSHNLNKYIWRFIALSTAQPRVITIEATSEQEARQQSPDGCVMVFAARIRQGVHHVQ
ncbi:TPA: host cell division inhibitor Icd-like protein [Escherichia coli]|uniref:Host cell division inhibitor Icd-like protein n=3 Tax=Escherichia coli TaxID=562 RepID=A0A8S7IGH9_ECOLX|nr:host cell division inhibitor Icd-like protein [Escherichia coli]EFH7980972.1 host cell division inhibitor Icd-like protein [Escherichia coli]EFT2743099.1 host cell division inhibitor Icd-like protein [Escherichia coli]EHC1611214.1 host cell division inhibitor Icd-like protein [Escherichia coli]EIP0500010.1 host cell division inhibitor Icd-like protein [Escherichia coli]